MSDYKLLCDWWWTSEQDDRIIYKVNYEYSVLESEKNGLLADHVCSIYLCNQKQTESVTIPPAFLLQVLGNWSWSSWRVLLAILQFSAVSVEQWSHSSHCNNKTLPCGISTEVECLLSHKTSSLFISLFFGISLYFVSRFNFNFAIY